MLDHFCCFIENELNKGGSFASSYIKALKYICPNEINEIQKETIYLLNPKKIITMKMIMYLIGLLASMSMTLGWLFKYLNWKGGGDMLTYGMICFLLLFVPMLAFNRYKMTLGKALSENLEIILGFSGAIVTGLGIILRTSGMQYGSLLVIIGTLIIAFGFLPFLFFRMYRKSLEQI
ncbi:hypothetical protein [Algoriphagus ratkowskyi]|uniref:DUF2157 domain-containing protein n=2 Tax=Algoriphagus ratkowskyi TaxID=57028 RepID=A0ABY3HRX6_9BACT|nr:hypothetical protein [Algoriphagus ratkowskyi]TXD79315.1 hypothetical protein ESW18_03535 [Algoriphagus ratkowskyi]